MIVILSPAKDMVINPVKVSGIHDLTLPEFLDKADGLAKQLKKFNLENIAGHMAVNEKLALLNLIRFQQWDRNHSVENATCSILAYTGEAYRGLMANDFTDEELNFSQEVLRILSGLYGILRPLDLIQAYRLEMGLNIPFKGIKNLAEYWREAITTSLNKAIKHSPGEKVLINLASAEYSSVINFKKLRYPVVTPSFNEEKSGQRKMITVYTKRARGLMTRFIIQNKIEKSEELKAFSDEGYYFENQSSKENNWLFVR